MKHVATWLGMWALIGFPFIGMFVAIALGAWGIVLACALVTVIASITIQS